MRNVSIYMEKPIYEGYEGIYTFGGEPMGISK